LSFCHIFIDYVTDLTRAPTMTAAFLSWPTRLAEAAATLLQFAPIADNHGSNITTMWNPVTSPGPSAEVCAMLLIRDVGKVNAP
jgi:hypothetical protein